MTSRLLPGLATAHMFHVEPVQVKRFYTMLFIMETDRAQTDLGEAVNAELSASKSDAPKQPKKRFIGRKAAAEKAEKNGGSNATIEDSGAIQGLQNHDRYTNN